MSESPRFILAARWVASMASPLLRDAAVAIEHGWVAAVGPHHEVVAQFDGAVIEDLGDAVILPGLINAHTHLELSACVAGNRPASFTDWILSLPSRSPPNTDTAAAARAGMEQSLRYGVTTLGDISQKATATRAALRDGPAKIVSFGEVLGVGGSAGKVQGLFEQSVDAANASKMLSIGVSPHAPYSMSWPDYERISRQAIDRRLPVATHLAELPYEADYLLHHRGPLREFMERFGIWRDDIETFPGPPIAMAKAAGLLEYPSLLAHVNYCSDDELALLAAGPASVVYCPRTHDYFSHPPHRWQEMLAAGINVAIGTDSCASSPNLNLVDDLRLLRRIAPDVSVETLWQMATTRGAAALGLRATAGAIAVGRPADFVAFAASSVTDPLAAILESDALPIGVWIDGSRLAAFDRA